MSRIEFRPAHPLQALLLSASALAIATPAAAHQIVFSTDRELEIEAGERTSQASGLTQVRLDSGAIASFVDSADYRINSDGSVDLYAGTVTVAGADGAVTVVRMPDGVEGRVGGGAAGIFSVAVDGRSRGHALTGGIAIARGGDARTFDAGELWSAGDERVRQVVSNGTQGVPGGTGIAPQVADMEQGGPLAAAENGLPVSLGDALAAAGASGDILAAARRVEASAANPDLATFPTGDLAALLSYAAQLQNAYGGQAFPGAQPDIIRTYLGYLAGGGSGASFLSAYAGILVQYLDLLRAGALPSSFQGAAVADLNAFLGYTGRTSGFGALSGQNRALVDAYLAFLSGGGNADLFVRSYTDLVTAYFAFLRGGGDPLAFQGASQQTLAAYIAFLSQSGLSAQLTAADRALLDAYLANGGLAFTGQYRTALGAYFDFLAAGNLPSGYTALDAAMLRAYLEALQSTGLFDEILGSQAQFYAAYLAHLQGGGAIDGFAGLNANLFSGYADQLAAYYEFLLQGGQPSAYEPLTQQQIAAYLAALQGAGASGAFLDDLAGFYAGYFAYLAGGGDPDVYTGLPVLNLPGFADALNAYAAFLAGGGLPSGYTAINLQTLAQYIDALSRSGQLGALLGGNAGLLEAYFAWLAGGGSTDTFAGLPVYAGYVAALEAYYAYLAGGGLPTGYTALTQAQIEAYLAALAAAGGFNAQFGDLSDFFTSYYAFVAAGGNPANFAGLPVYADWLAALEAYYAYLAGGGLPSGYTLLTQAQILAYLEALSGAGVLSAELNAEQLTFVLGYLAYLQSGADPDTFAELPANNQPATLLAGANAWIFSNEGGQIAIATTADVEDDGQIVSAALQLSPGSTVTFDYSNNTLREHGRAGGNVAWTRYERAASAGGITNNNVHLLLGVPATQLPTTGTVDYKLIGGTAPTNVFAAAGEIGAFSGDLAVAFGAVPRVGLNFDVHVGTRGWRAQTPGGAAGAATGGLAVGGNMNFQNLDLAKSGIAGNACSGYCNVQVFGGLFGPGAANAGFQYHIDDQSSGGRSYVNGTAVFGTTGTELALIGTMPGSGDGGGGGGGNTEIPALLTGYSGGFNPSTAGIGITIAGRIGANTGLFGETGFTTNPYSLNGSGGLTSYTRQPGGSPTRTNGSATITDIYGNADALIGRWTNGTTTGANAFILNANQGTHYLLTRPITADFVMPTNGRIDYYLIAATQPTIADGSMAPGTFSADMALLFGPTVKVAMEGQIVMPSLTYGFSTTGGMADAGSTETTMNLFAATPGFFTFSFNGNDGTGNCGTSSCTFSVSGNFTGGDTDTVGINYSAFRSAGSGFGGTAIFAAGPARTGGSDGDGGTGGTGGGDITSDFTGTRNPQVFYTFTNGSLALGFGGSATLEGGKITGVQSAVGNVTTTGQIVEAGDLTDLAWARWTNGNVVTTGIFAGTTAVGANGGYHLMTGTPPTSVPASGKVDYALIASTAATDDQGSAPGTVTGDLAIQFGTVSKVGYNMEMAVGGRSWAVATTGGAANPSASEVSLTLGAAGPTFSGAFTSTSNTVTASGGACSGTCLVNVSGALYGANGVHAGVTMNVIDASATGSAQASGLAIFSADPALTAGADWSRFDSPELGQSVVAAAGRMPAVEVSAADASLLLNGAITFGE